MNLIRRRSVVIFRRSGLALRPPRRRAPLRILFSLQNTQSHLCGDWTRIMSFRLYGPGILLALLVALPAAHSQTQTPLTLEQVLDIARTKNPTLLSVQQHVDATKASEITAGLRQNPNFTVSGADVSLPASNPASPYSYAANVNRLFERGQKRRWRLDAAQSTTDVTR